MCPGTLAGGPECWDIVGLLVVSPGKAWCQGKKQPRMQPNLFSRLCWDPSPNKLGHAWSWQGAGPAPQPRVQHSAWEPGPLCRLQGQAALPVSLTATLHPGFPAARTVQPHATAWGSCLQMGVHATAWGVPVLIPKFGSLLMQHHPGSPLAQPALQGIPSVAARAAAEQALDGFGPSACGVYVGERQLWGEPISTVTEIQDHP